MEKRLTRDTDRGILGGVCSGLSNYFDVDVTIIRLLWILASCVLGVGLGTYLIVWLIMPRD